MIQYHRPFILKCDFRSFAATQSVSGETAGALSCSGAGSCSVSPLGADCNCGGSFLNITYLVPGVNCADIHNGADCSIFPACLNPEIEATQCGAGCVIDIGCDAQGGCTGVDYTVSCPGFEDCSANAGSPVC